MTDTESSNVIPFLRRHRIVPSWRRQPGAPKKIEPPNGLQRAALIAARDGGKLTLTHGRGLGFLGKWMSDDGSGPHHLTSVISACRRRGWLTDAPGYEMAMKPSWTPVVITDAGLIALGKGE